MPHQVSGDLTLASTLAKPAGEGEYFNKEGRVRNVHLLFHNYTIVPQNAQNAKYYKVEHSKNTDDKWNNKMATLNDPHMCFLALGYI